MGEDGRRPTCLLYGVGIQEVWCKSVWIEGLIPNANSANPGRSIDWRDERGASFVPLEMVRPCPHRHRLTNNARAPWARRRRMDGSEAAASNRQRPANRPGSIDSTPPCAARQLPNPNQYVYGLPRGPWLLACAQPRIAGARRRGSIDRSKERGPRICAVGRLRRMDGGENRRRRSPFLLLPALSSVRSDA